MKLFDCPEWVKDDDTALPAIATAASSFLRFMNHHNPKGYLFDHGDIKQWHKNLFEHIAPVSYYAGNYRGKYPNKPCLNVEVHVGGVFGVGASEVDQTMKRFSEELVRSTISTDEYMVKAPPLDRIKAAAQLAAFAGGSLIRIHPFVNGNGRMARLTMNFFLHRYLNRIPFYIDRPTNPDYSLASSIAMRDAVYTPLYQYLLEIIALS